ncbi:MAG: hypothetical protein IT374_20000 [Polyangiaceae bacterium]|nr:hypothetical protein [Polyangiaceae bacterium]
MLVPSESRLGSGSGDASLSVKYPRYARFDEMSTLAPVTRTSPQSWISPATLPLPSVIWRPIAVVGMTV